MADNPGDPHIAGLIKQLAPFAPGFAGAVVSVAWQTKLTRRAAITSVVLGALCSMYAAPATSAVLRQVWPWGQMPTELVQLITFFWGLFGMVILSAVAVLLPQRLAVLAGLLRAPAVAGDTAP